MRTRTSTVRVLILSTALLVTMSGEASRSAPAPQDGARVLFADAGPEADAFGRAAQERAYDPTVLRSRRVTVNLTALLDARAGDSPTSASATLLLNLFDDASYVAVMDRVDPDLSRGRVDPDSRGFTWVGHIPGMALSAVTLSTQDGILSGSVVMPEAVYAIRYAGGGVHDISQVDQSAFLPELNPIPVLVPEDIRLSRAEQIATGGDSGSLIDLMVLYTPAAAAAAGGTSAMATLINLGVSETNTSYANSGIIQRLRLVHSEQVAHTERNDLAEDLYDVSNYDGSARSTALGNTAALLRDTYGADLVTLVTAPASPNGCGIAWLMSSVGSGFAPYAFSVVERSCVSPNYTFAHELGHNMGARHDWFVDNFTTPHTYAHGFVNTANRWRTIMAYNNLCPALLGSGQNCTRVLYWSNPAVAYNGAPMGIPGGTKSDCPQGDRFNTACDADDHRTLNDTAYTVANFRQTVEPTAPPFGVVDTPAQNATGVTGSIGVTGWALDDVGIQSVKLYRNCLPAFEPAANCGMVGGYNLVYMGDADIVPGARPDVEAAYPTYPQANRAGWGYLLLTNVLPHIPAGQMFGGQGQVSIYVFATDVEGRMRLLGRSPDDQTPTTITLANDTATKPFGAIDTPRQGETVSGTVMNFGWALTPDANKEAGAGDILIPIDGSTMWVWIDGAPVGTVQFNLCRGTVGSPVPPGRYCDDDVASIFGNSPPQATFTPRYANPTKYRNLDVARGAIGAYVLDTTTLSNGRHSIVWGVTDSAGRVDGIGSRDFIVFNGGAETIARRSAR